MSTSIVPSSPTVILGLVMPNGDSSGVLSMMAVVKNFASTVCKRGHEKIIKIRSNLNLNGRTIKAVASFGQQGGENEELYKVPQNHSPAKGAHLSLCNV